MHNLKSYTARRIINAKTLILIENGRIIDKNMKKMDLKEAAGIGSTTLSKLSKNQPVSMEVIMKLCGVLGCNVGDIMDVIEKQ